MRLDTSINRKRELTQAIHSLWRDAALCQLSHYEVLSRRVDLIARYKGMPSWVREYLHGVNDTLAIAHEQNTEFCYVYNGMLYSTHKDTSKLSTEYFYEHDIASVLSKCECGFYYKTSDKKWS